MAGREDYEERRQEKIERLKNASGRAGSEAQAKAEYSHDLLKDIPFGQPNIRGALTGAMNKSRNAMDKSISLSEKSSYYANRAEAAEKNKAISSDDPKAIEKLTKKLQDLESFRESIKAEDKELKKAGKEQNASYFLSNLAGNIKTVKTRIDNLQRLEQMPEENIKFDGGELISSIELNRVQLKFDNRQSEEITKLLKMYGFHWSPSNGAWQRLRSFTALRYAKKIININ